MATEQFLSDTAKGDVWTGQDITALVGELERLKTHGLNPADYHLALLQSGDLSSAERDRIATDAWMSAAAHMLYGKLDPVSIEPNWTAGKRQVDFASVLSYALESGTISGSLEQFAPMQPGYALLKSELARLRDTAAQPIARVSDGPALKPGMETPRVREMQARLIQLGLMEPGSDTGKMDTATVSAVETLQVLEGLEDDGVAGGARRAQRTR